MDSLHTGASSHKQGLSTRREICLSVTVEKYEPSLKPRNESCILFNRNRSFRKKKPNNTMTRNKGLSSTQKSWPRGQCGRMRTGLNTLGFHWGKTSQAAGKELWTGTLGADHSPDRSETERYSVGVTVPCLPKPHSDSNRFMHECPIPGDNLNI